MGISKFQIWTEACASSTDGSEAWLFVNGRHQVKVTVGLSLAKNDDKGDLPSFDEVKNALALITNQNGNDLKYLTEGNAGAYTEVYEPNHANFQSMLKSANFDYEVEYYLSCDVAKNPNLASEEVSVKLTYTSSFDTVIVNDLSANGSFPQKAFIKIHCIREKINELYITMDKADPQVEWSFSTDHQKNYVDCYRLRYKDTYFHMIKYTSTSIWKKYYNDAGINCVAYHMNQDGDESAKWQVSSFAYCPTLSTGLGEKTSGHLAFIYKTGDVNNGENWGSVKYKNVQQKAHEFVFLCLTTDVNHRDADTGQHLPEMQMVSYDQFGNETPTNVAFKFGGDRYHTVWPTINGEEPPVA
jgi:hypothetical protein